MQQLTAPIGAILEDELMEYVKKSDVSVLAFKVPEADSKQETDLPSWIQEAIAQKVLKKRRNTTKGGWMVETKTGRAVAKPGDYLIKNSFDELYPCPADVFEANYQSVKIKKGQEADSRRLRSLLESLEAKTSMMEKMAIEIAVSRNLTPGNTEYTCPRQKCAKIRREAKFLENDIRRLADPFSLRNVTDGYIDSMMDAARYSTHGIRPEGYKEGAMAIASAVSAAKRH